MVRKISPGVSSRVLCLRIPKVCEYEGHAVSDAILARGQPILRLCAPSAVTPDTRRLEAYCALGIHHVQD